MKREGRPRPKFPPGAATGLLLALERFVGVESVHEALDWPLFTGQVLVRVHECLRVLYGVPGLDGTLAPAG